MRDVHHVLRQMRFEPRSSLLPELLGRVGRGDQPTPPRPYRGRRWRPIGLAAIVTGLLAVFALPRHQVTVDSCCYDLDGGGVPDDGAVVVADRNGRVSRLSVYEDRDTSRTLTEADVVRLVRAGVPMAEHSIHPGFTTIRHCCQDLDGGGPPDDGLLVIATPPDRVHTAAIYELR